MDPSTKIDATPIVAATSQFGMPGNESAVMLIVICGTVCDIHVRSSAPPSAPGGDETNPLTVHPNSIKCAQGALYLKTKKEAHEPRIPDGLHMLNKMHGADGCNRRSS